MKFHSMIYVAAVVALATGSDLASAAGLYRWVDKDGKVQYSEKPPSEASATEIKVDKVAPSSDGASPDQTQLGNQGKCETMKCLADQMERDRLKREAEYARERGDNERPKKSSNRYDNPNLDSHLRERCIDSGAAMKGMNCNDTDKLREHWGFPPRSK